MARPSTATVVVVHTEMVHGVTAQRLGDRVALNFGDDRSGVRLVGDLSHLRALVIEAAAALGHLRGEQGR